MSDTIKEISYFWNRFFREGKMPYHSKKEYETKMQSLQSGESDKQ